MQAALLAILYLLLLSTCNAFSSSTLTYSQQKCFTKYGQSTVRNPLTKTASFTITIPYPTFVKSTVVKTVTPPLSTTVSTSTVTSTVTSVQTAMTDTYTSSVTPSTTSTSTATTTETTTIQSTITVFSTPPASTSTVGTPDNYTPLGTQLDAATFLYSRKKRSRVDEKPLFKGSKVIRRTPIETVMPIIRKRSSIRQYPQAVQCNKLVEEVVLKTFALPVKKTTTSTIPASTTTSLTTTTVTSTFEEKLPNLSTTVTTTLKSTNTIIITSTSTTTSPTIVMQTSTSTLPPATETYYPGCARDNIISQVDKQNIISYTDDGGNVYGYTPTTTTALNALECCQRCQDFANVYFENCEYYFYQATKCTLVGATEQAIPYMINTGSDGIPSQMGNGGGGRFNGLNGMRLAF